MTKIAIPPTARLLVRKTPSGWPKSYSPEEAKAEFGEDIFRKIEAKGKHEQKRSLRCSTHHADPCIGSFGTPEVFRYGRSDGWVEKRLPDDAQDWPYKVANKPGFGWFPLVLITAEDFGRTVINHKVTFQNMEAVWTEEFQNG